MGLFAGKEIITARDVAKERGLSESPQMSFNAGTSNLNANKLIIHQMHNGVYVSKNNQSRREGLNPNLFNLNYQWQICLLVC